VLNTACDSSVKLEVICSTDLELSMMAVRKLRDAASFVILNRSISLSSDYQIDYVETCISIATFGAVC
jgi:hypothetical protein